jgi:hypothetical protein
MLLGARRTATIVALDNCELYSLGRGEVEDLLRVWPEMWRDFAGMAEVRRGKGGRAGMSETGPGGRRGLGAWGRCVSGVTVRVKVLCI